MQFLLATTSCRKLVALSRVMQNLLSIAEFLKQAANSVLVGAS